MKGHRIFPICTLIIVTLLTSDIFPIPAFARKYNMTCKTCHSPFPKLKSYALDFAGNGFQLKDKDAPRYFVETGDPELSLIRDLPIAMRLEGYVTYNQGQTDKPDFYAPSVFKLLSGGALTNDIAYYVYYILENGEAGKIEDAWLMFNNLFGSELDVSIGQFQVSDPIFKRELRLTREDYLIYKLKPGNSMVDLTYDRGLMLAYGFDSGTDVTVEILNGSGIGEGLMDGNFDNDKYKNLFGFISQDIGENFSVGALGYWGKEKQLNLQSDLYATNDIWMAGGNATLSIDPIELNVQYVERSDGNPNFEQAAMKVKSRGAFTECVLRPDGDNSKWYAVALFNWIESDLTEYNSKSIGAGLGYLLRRNIRLVGEYDHNFTDKYGTVSVGFVTAF